MIRIYNTLTKQKEEFKPVNPDGKTVGIYLCGPTVYKPSHIGHMVGPVIFDAIKRYLTYRGYDVRFVINITDVDDKLIAEANRRGIPMSAVADEMTADYWANLEAMGVKESVTAFPKATEHIGNIVNFVQKLIDKGFAYESEGDVYYDVGKFADYGKLSHRSLESMLGEGGSTADRKHTPFDFALWKSAKPGEPSWDSPWGKGRPGWHIECSVMSKEILGETFDIHGCGLDLVFPHHENEVAQSEACHGKPMCNFWMHNGLMQASNETGKVGGRNTSIKNPQRSAAELGDSPIGPFVFGTDGSGADLLMVPAGGMRMPKSPETAVERPDSGGNLRSLEQLKMHGPGIFSFAIDRVPPTVDELLRKSGKNRDDIGCFIFHQANKYMLDRLRELCEIDEARYFNDMMQRGNTVSSSIPIAVVDAWNAGMLKPEQWAMLVGFGVGLSWAGTLVRLPNNFTV